MEELKDVEGLDFQYYKPGQQPFLSIVVLTYNHENYIQMALDGILKQQTDFLVEVLITDDCSTDQTAEILREYQRRFPGVFTVEYAKENQGPTKNLYNMLMRSQGKYIALLETDDYWTDPLKLQKQVDLLESHEEFIACTHKCVYINKDGSTNTVMLIDGAYRSCEIFKLENLEEQLPAQTSTFVLRNVFAEVKHDYTPIYRLDRLMADKTLWVILLGQGNIFKINEAMSCYRYTITDGNNASSQFNGKQDILSDYLFKLSAYAKEEFGETVLFQKKQREYFGQVTSTFWNSPSRAGLRKVFAVWRNNPRKGYCFKHFVKVAFFKTFGWPFRKIRKLAHSDLQKVFSAQQQRVIHLQRKIEHLEDSVLTLQNQIVQMYSEIIQTQTNNQEQRYSNDIKFSEMLEYLCKCLTQMDSERQADAERIVHMLTKVSEHNVAQDDMQAMQRETISIIQGNIAALYDLFATPLEQIVPQLTEKVHLGDISIKYLLRQYEFATVLDIGCGAGEHSDIFINAGKDVTAIDIGNSPYFKNNFSRVKTIIGDFNTYDFEEPFDCVWCCHVLEHQFNSHNFLKRLHKSLKEDGVLCITVPPAKQMICGGHVSMWNAGLLLYNLVLAGFDCSEAEVLRYGYNISVIVRKKSIDILDQIVCDAGDITTIRPYLPNNIPYVRAWMDISFNGADYPGNTKALR